MDYYYLDADMRQVGPVSLDDLVAAGVTGDTMVWHEDLEEWAKAGNLPEVVKAMERKARPATPEKPESPESPESPEKPEKPEKPESPEAVVIDAAADDEIIPKRPSKRLGMNIAMMVLTTLNPFYILGLMLVVPFAAMSITFGAIGESAYNRENYRLADRFGRLGRGFGKAALISGLIILLLEILFFVAIFS
ncbi:MAG: DUF4339 domain-containing protein [Bacteroidales bacterium]|nr:DUF4339 domain-containing protein [Bacteroidales bacterium]